MNAAAFESAGTAEEIRAAYDAYTEEGADTPEDLAELVGFLYDRAGTDRRNRELYYRLSLQADALAFERLDDDGLQRYFELSDK